MAVKTNITINIVEPGSDVPVPDTGLFTHGIGGTETTAIGAVLILTIAAIIVTILYRKQKKAGKVTKLVHIIDSTKAVLKSKKRITTGLTALALLASAGTLTALLTNAGKSNTNATEGDGLTLDVSSKDLTIEVKDQPVFAVLPVRVTVEEATQAGYTLTAYTDNTDLVSTTNPNNKIPMVTVEGDELTSLQDNTWGLALDNEPTAKDNKVYKALSTDQDNPTIIKTIDDYSETEAGDTTTIYYGFYITPDIPYGTYTGTNINYAVEPHYITNLSFNGNGNDGGEDMESIIIPAGDNITLPENTYTKEGYTFNGWNTVANPTEQEPGEAYADRAEYTAVEGETKDVTLYAQWKKKAPYMQDVATWGSKLEIGDEIIAVDNRDSKEYYVARLADGNIWMTQNLDLELDSTKTYTSADTDLPSNTNWIPVRSTTTSTSWDTNTLGQTTPYSYNPGNLYWNGTLIYDQATCEKYDGRWTSYAGCFNATGVLLATGNTHYNVGNYYNWTAAVAMNDSSSYTSQQDVNQSICPAGWRLPTHSGDKSYQNLVSAQGLTAGTSGNIQNSPVYFIYGGLWYGEFTRLSQTGGYISSAVKSRSEAYWLQFDTSGWLRFEDESRYHGISLRCVAR